MGEYSTSIGTSKIIGWKSSQFNKSQTRKLAGKYSQISNLTVQIGLLWQIPIYSLAVTITSHYFHSHSHSRFKPKYHFLQQPCWRDFLELHLSMLLLHHHNPYQNNYHPFNRIDKHNTICSTYQLHDPANNYIPQFTMTLKDKANNRS